MFNLLDATMQQARVEEKNAEFTFGVHAPSLLALVPDNQATIFGSPATEQILYELDKAVMGSVRSLNEKFQLLRQAIMYSFLWRIHPEHGIQFFVYRRTKKNNEGQLAHRLSLGAGGHFEFSDMNLYVTLGGGVTGVVSFVDSCNDNYYRERDEEIGVDGDKDTSLIYDTPTLQGFVMDSQPANPGYVGNIHFGVLAGVEVIDPKAELKMLESHNTTQGWFTPKELKAYITGDTASFALPESEEAINFEPWSVMVINQIDKLVHSLIAV